MVNSLDELKNILNSSGPEEEEQDWASFVKGPLMTFFQKHKVEKLTIENGNGSKARLVRMKDSGIKVEHSSTTIV